MVGFYIIQGYIDVTFPQIGVFSEVLEYFGHQLVTKLWIREHCEGGDICPEKVSVMVINIIRSLYNI